LQFSLFSATASYRAPRTENNHRIKEIEEVRDFSGIGNMRNRDRRAYAKRQESPWVIVELV